MMINIAVSFKNKRLQNKAAQLASQLQLPLVNLHENNYAFRLVYTEDYLEIRPQNQSALGPFHIDFLTGKLGFRQKHTFIKDELLAKAVGVKGNHSVNVIDATAGLGRDSFILASLGCTVTMLERSPIMAALLNDGLLRLLAGSQQSAKLKLNFIQTDAIQYLTKLEENNFPEVIYLDPMYPHRTKTALVKKELRIIRELVGADTDADKLFQLAVTRAQKRVVVKRPRLAPALSEKRIDVIYEGKQHRFDVYLTG